MTTKIPFENNVCFGFAQSRKKTKNYQNIVPFITWLAAVITVAWLTFGSAISG